MWLDILAITLMFFLFFFLSRGIMEMYLHKLIKKQRHRQERKQGQSFWEWLTYKRFRDVIPKSAYTYWIYYANIALYFILLIGIIVLYSLGYMEMFRKVIFRSQLVIIGIPAAACFASLGGYKK